MREELSQSLTVIIISNIKVQILFLITDNLNFAQGLDNQALWSSGKYWVYPNQEYSINHKEEVDFITVLAKQVISLFA